VSGARPVSWRSSPVQLNAVMPFFPADVAVRRAGPGRQNKGLPQGKARYRSSKAGEANSAAMASAFKQTFGGRSTGSPSAKE
jgi:hypothetical protein